MLERRRHDQRHASDDDDDDDDDRRRRSSSAHLGMIFVRRMIGVVQIAMRIFQDLSILGTEGLLLWAGDCQLYSCVCMCVCLLGDREAAVLKYQRTHFSSSHIVMKQQKDVRCEVSWNL